MSEIPKYGIEWSFLPYKMLMKDFEQRTRVILPTAHTEGHTMSNLNLPTMTHSNLSRVLGNRTEKKLAYATGATKGVATTNIGVYHHERLIAILFEDGEVWTTTAGWNSATTKDRLNRIIRDNNLPYSIFQKNFQFFLRNHETGEILPWEGTASFTPEHGLVTQGAWH